MEDLRLAIIVLGAFAIVGVLVHGIWTIRKNNQQDLSDEGQGNAPSKEHEADHRYIKINDDDPLMGNEPMKESEQDVHKTKDDSSSEGRLPPQYNYQETDEQDPLLGDKPLYAQSDLQTQDKTPAESQEEPTPVSVAADKRHRFDEDDIGEVRLVGKQEPPMKKVNTAESTSTSEPEPLSEPPSSLLKNDDDVKMKIDTSIDIDDKPKKRSNPEPKVTTETKKVGGKKSGIAEKARRMVSRTESAKKAEKDQIRLDLDEKVDADEVATQAAEPSEQEVLIISIKAPEGKVVAGAALLPALLTLGFKFGEHNMFHRHANSNGKGPKLFSLANMFNPGTFDIDNMENFTTAGLSLFMILPIEADPHQVFNMMHNAARKLADEFDLQILDGRRSALTKQSRQQYVEKIREFERRRMIKRA